MALTKLCRNKRIREEVIVVSVQVGMETKHLNLKMQSRLYLSVTIHLKQTQKLSVLLLRMRAFVIQ